MNVDIVATIGARKEYKDIINLIDNGITHYRVNFSRNWDDFEKRVKTIEDIRNREKRIELMIDIPYPGVKLRLFSKLELIELKKGDVIEISTFENASNRLFYTNIDNIINLINVGQEIIYSDGEARLEVIKKTIDGHILLKCKDDFLFRTGKTISIGYFKEVKNLEEIYLDAIDRIRPDEIALSFVENSPILKDFKATLKKRHINASLVSKIETQKGMDCIEEIAKESNLIFGRGDMLFNSDIVRLAENQSKIIETGKKYSKKTYIATGILNSLLHSAVPSQGDIIDLLGMKEKHVDGIILNSAIAFARTDQAIELIRRIWG